MATVFQFPKTAPVSAGSNYASAKCHFYQAGTTTNITTYTTAALSVPHANPVVADANGVFAPIFIDESVNATYKIRLVTSADVLIYEIDNIPTTLNQQSIGAVLWPRSAAEIAAGVIPTNYYYEWGDVRRYGAALDGATNDTAALDAAIDQQQQTGGADVIGVSGKTLYTSSWVAPTLTAKLRIRGNGMTFKNGNSTRVAFVTLSSNFDIQDCVFDGWYRVISNPVGTAGSITEGRFANNRCINATVGATNNAYYILIQNPVSNLWILDNEFKDGQVTAVYIGDNTYANQDTWKKITVRGNVIDGVTCPNGVGSSFGILVYGRDVVIDGNDVGGVEGYTTTYNASNGAFGIYTKARFCRTVNNAVRNIGLTTNTTDSGQIVGINVKGSDRAATATPQGYASIVANNTILSVGVAATSGYGISADHSGVLISENWVESAGNTGISLVDVSASADDGNAILGNVVLGSSNDAFDCIEASTSGSHTTISGNALDGGNGVRLRSNTNAMANVVVSNNITDTGISVRLTAETVNLSNVLVTGNMSKTATYGLYFSTSGGGVISDVSAAGNDWTGASTAAIGGTFPATLRLRNNRGYVSENAGVTGAIATGATVTHGMGKTPTVVTITAQDTGATDYYVSAIGATTFVINYTGGGTHVFSWDAKLAEYYQ